MVRSFVGGLELIVSLLKSEEAEVCIAYHDEQFDEMSFTIDLLSELIW